VRNTHWGNLAPAVPCLSDSGCLSVGIIIALTAAGFSVPRRKANQHKVSLVARGYCIWLLVAFPSDIKTSLRPATISVRVKARCRSAKFGTTRASHAPIPTSQKVSFPILFPASFTTPRGACSISNHIQSKGLSIFPLAATGFAGGLGIRSQPRITSPTRNPPFSSTEFFGISSITTPGSTCGSSGAGGVAFGSSATRASTATAGGPVAGGGDSGKKVIHGKKQDKANAER